MTRFRRSFSTILVPDSQNDKTTENTAPRRSFSLILTPDTSVSLESLAASIYQDERVCEQEELEVSPKPAQQTSPVDPTVESFPMHERESLEHEDYSSLENVGEEDDTKDSTEFKVEDSIVLEVDHGNCVSPEGEYSTVLKGVPDDNKDDWIAVDYLQDFEYEFTVGKRGSRRGTKSRRKRSQRSNFLCSFERMPGIVEQCPCRSGNQAACCAPPGIAQLNVYNMDGAESYNYLARAVGLRGVFHVGVEIFGVEWSFASVEDASFTSGVYGTAPRSSPGGVFLESIPLGRIGPRTAHGVWAILCQLSGQWLAADYHPISRNCIHFCRTFCKELGVQSPPKWIGGLVDTADSVRRSVYSALNVAVPDTLVAAEHNKELCSPSNEWYGLADETDPTLLDTMTEFEDMESWALSVMMLHDA